MSDLQKKTLRNLIFGVLIFAIIIFVIYLAIRFYTIRVALLWTVILIMAIIPLTIVYKAFSWDWKVKGILTEDEYKVYSDEYCDPFIRGGIRYIPTEEDIHILKALTNYDHAIIDAMYEKMNSLTAKKEVIK